jgi:outer membrane protein assembly factor BamB
VNVEKEIRTYVLILICIVSFSWAGVADAADWPQWRGPKRDGKSSETGLLKKWPESGLDLLWEMTGLGAGFSSMAIVDGKLYTMGDIAVEGQDRQCVICYDLAKRAQLWIAQIGPPYEDSRGGPRSTPTVRDGFVYVVGTDGDIVCVEADTGKIRWQKHLQKDLEGGPNPKWKYSESVLIDGQILLCTPGGRKAVIAAMDKDAGEVLWKCAMPDIGPKGKDEAGYSSIMISHGGGIKQYVQLTNKGLIGVAIDDGKFLWGYNKIANRVASISTPVIDGDYVFCSTAYDTGSALLKLTATNSGINAEEVYFLDSGTFQNHHGNFVQVDGYIYGGHGPNKGKPTCVQMKTGKVMWQQDQPGSGSTSVLYADGHLYFRYEDDTMALIEANPEQYKLKGKFKLPKRDGMDGPGWPHPVIVDSKLYIRHADVLFCYDITER